MIPGVMGSVVVLSYGRLLTTLAPREAEAKRSIMGVHLEPELGEMGLDEIDVAAITRFRAKLIVAWSMDEYARLLAAAKALDPI
ncbi:MAG TPA: hypothetical protein VN253_15365 [Kofleriaceae bacterium]|nr:hypothetical protein [Kofleriaceae bacterium]